MIGIIAAMDVEVQAIEEVATIQEKKIVGNIEFHYGKIKDQEIVIAKSGIGKSAAAMATTIMCMQHQLSALINVGTAGGLLTDEKVLDIVISNKVVQADFDTSPIDGDSGIGLIYQPSEKMIEHCERAAQSCGIRYHVGTIASQDIFMARQEDFDALMKKFPDSACSEMEGGAIAQVADSFQVPFVIIRCLSDVVHHNDNPMEFSEYAAKASQQTGKLVKTFVEEL